MTPPSDNSWLDDYEEDGLACLKCDIEIDSKEDAKYRTVVNQVARSLRDIAMKLEAGALETGWHDIPDRAGKKIGAVYLEFYSESSW